MLPSESPPSRRRFLQIALLTPVAAPPLLSRTPSAPSAAGIVRPALNVYSFADALNANKRDPASGLDLFGLCEFCARHNLEAMDVTGYFFPEYPKPPTDRFISRLKRHAHARGVVINGTGIRNDFATTDNAVRAAGVQLARDWIEVAARLGASVIRLFAGPQAPFKDWRVAAGDAPRTDVEAWMAESLQLCAEHGERFGVAVGVQNHGDFLSTGPEFLSLLRRVNHPFCGALVDTGMFRTSDPYADIAQTAPHAVGWQVKETLGSSLASPRADIGRIVRIIVSSGYRGFVPIETLAMGRRDYDPAAEVVSILGEMRRALAADASPSA